MSKENIEMTTETPAPKAPKAAPKSKSSTPSESGGSGEKDANPLGFEYEFLPLPTEIAASGAVKINPKEIAVSKVDARSAPAPVDEDFVQSIKRNGLLQDPLITFARHKKTGKDVWLIVAGRRRREGSTQAGLKEISCKAKEIKDLKEYLVLAGQENLKRDDMSLWDKYTHFSNLIALGVKQGDLQSVLNTSEGHVSQVMAVGKLDERVRKLVRDGAKEPFKSYAPTVVRELKRVNDPEMQTHFALEAIENKWEPKELKTKVEVWLNKQAAKGEAKPKAKGGRGVKLPDVVEAKTLKIIPKADLAAIFNFSAARFAKLSASEKAKPETIAYEKGRRDAFAVAAGLAEMPTLPSSEE